MCHNIIVFLLVVFIIFSGVAAEGCVAVFAFAADQFFLMKVLLLSNGVFDLLETTKGKGGDAVYYP